MGLEKKLMIPECKILEFPEHEVKPKIGNIHERKKYLNILLRFIKLIDPYFCEHYKEKIQVDKN